MSHEKIKLIKPAWKETLKFLAGMLDEEKATELVEDISAGYFKFKNSGRKYNPALDDLILAGKCINKNKYLEKFKEPNYKNLFLYLIKKNPVLKVEKEMQKWGWFDFPYPPYQNKWNLIDGAEEDALIGLIKLGNLSSIFAIKELEKFGNNSTIMKLRKLLENRIGSEIDSSEIYAEIYHTIRMIHQKYKPTTF